MTTLKDVTATLIGVGVIVGLVFSISAFAVVPLLNHSHTVHHLEAFTEQLSKSPALVGAFTIVIIISTMLGGYLSTRFSHSHSPGFAALSGFLAANCFSYMGGDDMNLIKQLPLLAAFTLFALLGGLVYRAGRKFV